MRWFENLSTGTKLMLTFGLVIAIFIGMVGYSYSTIKSLLKNNHKVVNDDVLLIENFMILRDSLADAHNHFMFLTLQKNPNEFSKNFTQQIALDEKIENVLSNIKTILHDNPSASYRVENIRKINDEKINIQNNQVLPLLKNNKVPEAEKIVTEVLYPKYSVLGDESVSLINDMRKKLNSDMALSIADVNQAITILILLGILALLLVITFVILLQNLISKPLKEISQATQKIANGDLSSVELASGGRTDEVGMLTDSFLLMRKNLHQLTLEIVEIILHLETAVNEISAATSELVTSAQETAAAITETSTTIEEVKQTSRSANDKAKLISDSVKRSNEISKAGNKAALEMTEMTNQIQNQMQLIAESMLRLSEQGQAIGSIMTTVDDIAQQSNLLSVNASIEAAKAGEQGKGFAVVAQEVKTLANQSKDATNQVREILDDIQKATSRAVMATEQGTKSVEQGVKKSEETGQSIGGLVKTVSESARDALQIAATTHEQLVGMEQAATAMENIKTATFQNVEGSKQLEESANNIKTLCLKLKQSIAHFKIEHEAKRI